MHEGKVLKEEQGLLSVVLWEVMSKLERKGVGGGAGVRVPHGETSSCKGSAGVGLWGSRRKQGWPGVRVGGVWPLQCGPSLLWMASVSGVSRKFLITHEVSQPRARQALRWLVPQRLPASSLFLLSSLVEGNKQGYTMKADFSGLETRSHLRCRKAWKSAPGTLRWL